MRSSAIAIWVALAALPIAFLAHADAPASGDPLPSALDGGVPAEPPAAGYAPDPTPLVTRSQWVVSLRFRAGTVTFGGARRVELAKAVSTARMMGRFAIELYVGKQLLDRVRFDFPLLGADELAGGARRWDSPPSFARNLSSQALVTIPHSDRATRAVLLDRATGGMWLLPWPFTMRPDAGVPVDGG